MFPHILYLLLTNNLFVRSKKLFFLAFSCDLVLLLNVLKYHPFLIKPNNLELGEIFGKTPVTDTEIRHCAAQLQAKGARNVLVSMAGDGSLLVDERGNCHRLGVPKGKVRNSVGAGDSMVAGFLAGWLETGDYAYAQRGYFAVGGEVMALLLPYFYWAVSRTVKDFVVDMKRR